jgi:sterol desaturase/sphingolipid hydroxylase (fatty acid hydroxylase superfamily)
MGTHSFVARMATAGAAGFLVVHVWALLGAIGHYAAACNRRKERPSATGLLHHLLPRDVLVSRWTRLDLVIFAAHRVVDLAIFQVGIAMILGAEALAAGLSRLVAPGPLLAPSFALGAAFLVLGLVARDFASFFVHYLQHRIPLLWEFHKVHHAPETLIPPSTRRLHPVDELTGVVAEALLLGVVIGVEAWLTGLPTRDLIAAAVGLYAIVNMLTFAPLRHSHIDLRLGLFEHFLMSPAHHQLHHSAETAHWDRNFGSILPFWDRLWGTYYVPPPRGTYRLGLPNGQSEAYATLWGCYALPLWRAWRVLVPARPRPVSSVAAIAEDHEIRGREFGAIEAQNVDRVAAL